MSCSKEIDDELLIAAVQSWPAIYDRGHKYYHNRTYIGRAWENIAKEVGYDENSCRKRWQHIRDYYVRIYRMSKNAAQDGTPMRRIKWHLYDQMSFMTPLCVENETTQIIQKDEDEIMVSEIDGMPYEGERLSPAVGENSVLSDDFNRSMITDHKLPQRLRKRRAPSIGSGEQSETDIKPFRAFQEPEVRLDPNELFFKSLIPSVEKLDDIQVMEFRIEVQGLLLKYMKSAKQNSSPPSGSASTSTSCVGTPVYDEVNGHPQETLPSKSESQSSNHT